MTTLQLTVDTNAKTVRATKDGIMIDDLSNMSCDIFTDFDGNLIKMLEIRTRTEDDNGVTHLTSMFWTWKVDGSGTASAAIYTEKRHALPNGKEPNQARKELIASMIKIPFDNAGNILIKRCSI